MKKGLKFWSKLLIASFFLGGMATSAIAQASWDQRGWRSEHSGPNGRTQCDGRVLKVTKTQQQMLDGTDITLKFNDEVIGDMFYLVAEGGGSLTGVNGSICNVDDPDAVGNTNVNYGANLQVGTVTLDAQGNVTDFEPTTTPAGITIVAAADGGNTIGVKAMDVDGGLVANVASRYFLGVYIQDVAVNDEQAPTSCYSDVYYVEIEVLSPIYASLTLNAAGKPNEYICNGAKTNTNIGITLCNLPADYTGIFSYKALVDNDDDIAVISGSKAYAETIDGALDHEGEAQGAWVGGVFTPQGTTDMASGTTSALTISGITPVDRKYTVKIGRQTLTNGSDAVAGTAKYTFAEMTYSYDRGDGVTVTLPVIFESASGYCEGHSGTEYPNVFTVYVAPALNTQALAYTTPDRIGTYTPGQDTVTAGATPFDPTNPTFCQGTLAYLFAETSANAGTSSEGDLFGATTYAWSQVNGVDPYILSFTENANIQAPTTSELTKDGTNAYKLHLVATWNDAGNNYGTTGCTAEDDININVTAAPILLVATDETDGTWNSTDVITASEVCPSNSIFINTLDAGTPELDGTGRVDAIMAGNYIKHNGAEIKWTIDVPTNMGAYSTWRTTAVDATGNIAVTDPDTNPDVTHYLDNESVTPTGIITYTLENAGTTANTCKLVKSDGSSLNLAAEKDGKVQVKYPVSVRPTFSLGN